MSEGNLYTVPSTGVQIKLIPMSMTAEMMLATDENPPPKPPIQEVVIAGILTQERSTTDPSYLKAYDQWDNLLQFDVMKRMIQDLALEQDLTDEALEWCRRRREALEGTRALPKSDHILWFFKKAIGTDQDMQDIIKACGRLSEPQEDRIAAKRDKF